MVTSLRRACLLMAGMMILALVGMAGCQSEKTTTRSVGPPPPQARRQSPPGPMSEPGPRPSAPQARTNVPTNAINGEQVFQTSGCLGCHTMDGKGGHMGPNLTHEATRHRTLDWQIAHLKDPKKMSPGSRMPSFARLSEAQLHALAEFLNSRK